MSGQYGPRTGIYTVGSTNRFDTSRRPLIPVPNVQALAKDKTTVAAALVAAGYATGMFGKWHLGNNKDGPLQPGFGEALVSMGRHFDFTTQPPVKVPAGTYLADYLTDRAEAFIEKNKDRPFFLYLPHFGVHSPHQAKKDLIARFAKKEAVGGHDSPTYAAMIASVDESVGRVLKKLKELKLEENTLVMFSSDNGGVGGYAGLAPGGGKGITSNAPLRGGKGMLYEGGVRVPWIVRWPGRIKAGTLCDEPIISVDLYPTLLDLAGSKPWAGYALDGVSLTGLLFGEGKGRLKREAVYSALSGVSGAGQERLADDAGGGRADGRVEAVGVLRGRPVGVVQPAEGRRRKEQPRRGHAGEGQGTAREAEGVACGDQGADAADAEEGQIVAASAFRLLVIIGGYRGMGRGQPAIVQPGCPRLGRTILPCSPWLLLAIRLSGE